jgi:copper(I)-binding protein
MFRKLIASGVAAVALIATLTACAAPVDDHAGHDHASALTVTDVWVKAVPDLGEMPMTGAFMVIENTSDEDLYITGGTDSSGITEMPLEAHEVVMDDSGEMVMQVVDGGIKIPAGESVQLMPGGYHIMYLMMLKPKKRAQPLSANNLTESRREVAARRIGRAAKKYLAARPGRGQGPSPRSPRTLARQTNLGIMGGRRRSPGAANNTRITWSRNANGKINRFKTLENINMKLTQAERNALNNMTENQAVNYIRNLARQR